MVTIMLVDGSESRVEYSLNADGVGAVSMQAGVNASNLHNDEPTRLPTKKACFQAQRDTLVSC